MLVYTGREDIRCVDDGRERLADRPQRTEGTWGAVIVAAAIKEENVLPQLYWKESHARKAYLVAVYKNVA